MVLRIGSSSRPAICRSRLARMSWIVVLSVASLLVACASLYVGTRPSKAVSRDRMDTGILLCGLTLFAAPILLQAPIAAFGSPLDVKYVRDRIRNAGAALLFADCRRLCSRWRPLSPLPGGVRRCSRGASASARCALLVAISAALSHRNARAFAHRSFEISDVARKAVAVVDRLNIPGGSLPHRLSRLRTGLRMGCVCLDGFHRQGAQHRPAARGALLDPLQRSHISVYVQKSADRCVGRVAVRCARKRWPAAAVAYGRRSSNSPMRCTRPTKTPADFSGIPFFEFLRTADSSM